VVSSVQMCGFEGNNLVDLRADFGIFADTKHQELPGASPSFRRSEVGDDKPGEIKRKFNSESSGN